MPIPDFVVELRRHLGTARLWLPGVTAVVRRVEEVLLVRRADNGQWAPITGILEPGEEPSVAAVRETREETCVEIRVDRLAAISSGVEVTHANGDLAVYLDHTFACTWVAGQARVGDDESIDVGWWPLADLPPMRPGLLERITAAVSGETEARFHRP